MATSFYSGSGLTNAEQDSIESSIAAAEAAKVAAEAAQAAAETAETNSETAKANSESAKVAAQAAQTSAETAETNALASSASASTSATQSAASATSSASSAASASSAQTASETAQAAAEAALDSFDDTYLGAKTSDPALDNDGNALIDGALYFNTTDNVVKVYDLGSTSWTVVTLSSTDSTNLATVSGQITPTNNLATVAGDSANIGTVASNISGVNSFAERYRVGTTNPTTSLDAGDLFYNTTDDELKVYDGSSWTTGVITGNATQSSDGTMSAADKTKLDGIETAADVTDTTNVVAALTAGDNITIAADGTVAASGGEITVQDEGVDLSTAATTLNFTGTGVTATGTGAAKTIDIAYSDATTSAAGLMSSTDKTKLDGIEASADVTDTTNVVASLTAGTNITIAGDGTISASGGSDADTLDGLDSTQFLRSDASDTLTGTLDIEAAHSQLTLTDTDDSKFVLFSYSGGDLVLRNNSTTTTEDAFTFTEEGTLGIGTTSPNNNIGLHIVSSSDEKLLMSGTSNPFLQFAEGTTDKCRVGWDADGFMQFMNLEGGDFRFYSSSNSPDLVFTRGDTSTVSGNDIGSLNFGHIDGSPDYHAQTIEQHPVRILAEMAETAGSGDDGARLRFYTKPINGDKDINSTERFRIDHDGHVYAYGDMTVSGTLNATVSIPSTLNATTFDGDVTVGNTSDDHQLKLYKADNNVSDHLQFYVGSTRIGEIGGEDTTWFRINQETSKNIYTPRMIRADGGFQATSTICAHVGDTNTYMQFHASDQWRVVTGGTERLEVNNSNTTVANNLIVSGTVSNNKAKWSNIDGTGTIAIRDDNGISTIQDLGTGKYLQNFSFNMANATYSSVNSGTQSNTGVVARPGTYQLNATSSSTVRHSVMSSGGAIDVDYSRHYFIGD